MSTAILKNTLSGETVYVKEAKGRAKHARKYIDVWVDESNVPICKIGNEEPNWQIIVINRTNVVKDSAKGPVYPIGTLCR